MDVERIYWYYEGETIQSSHDLPQYGTKYIEKIINTIGVPDVRAISIKDFKGQLLYNNIENIPLENTIIKNYLKKGDDNDTKNN